jgi:hypothetical protein
VGGIVAVRRTPDLEAEPRLPTIRDVDMGMWRKASRSHCHGLFVDNGVLYARRYVSDPAFRQLRAAEEREHYLTPIPIPLANARVFLDAEFGRRRLDLPDDVNLIAPAVPLTRGNTYYTVSVITDTDDVYIGYPVSTVQATKLLRAIDKLVESILESRTTAHTPTRDSHAQ